MEITKYKLIILGIFAFFVLLSGAIKVTDVFAVDPGCSPQYPSCLGTTVVNRYRCINPPNPVGGSWVCQGTEYLQNSSVSCNNQCSFQSCSSNDLPLNCGPVLVDGEWICKPDHYCTNTGNCCGAGEPTPPPTPDPDACNNPTLGTTPTQSCNADGTTKNVSWSWSAISGALTYRLEIDTVNTFTNPVVEVTSALSFTQASVDSPSTVRYGRVRVETSNNSCTSPSAWSSITTLPGITCIPNSIPTCSLSPSGTTSKCVGDTVAYTGTCGDGNNNMNSITLYTVDSTLANPTPAQHIQFCSQSFSPGVTTGSCAASKTWNTAGSYYVEVNAADAASQGCSANPWCEWPPNDPPPTTLTCQTINFSDCGPNDLATVTVNAVGTPTISGSTSCSTGSPQNTISWGSVTCGNTYQVYRCTGAGCTPTTLVTTTPSSSYVDSSVTSGIVYRYRIRGVAPAGALGSYSNTIALTASTCAGQCSAPALTVSKACNATGNSDNTWSWGAVVGATSYRLLVDNNSDFSSPEVNTTVASTSYSQLNVAPSTVWYGKVRVETSNSSCISPSAYSAVVQTDGLICAGQCSAPVISVSKACNVSGNSDNTWSWGAVGGATSYRLLVDNNSDFLSPEVNTVLSLLSYNQLNVSSSTIWYGKVRVETSNSSCTAPGAYSIATATNGLGCSTCNWATLVPAAPVTLAVNGTETYSATFSVSGASITNVTYLPSSNIVAFSSPNPDPTPPYSNTVTGTNPGTVNILASALLSNGEKCDTNSVTITVVNPSCTIDLIPDGTTANPYKLKLNGSISFTGNVVASPFGTVVDKVTFVSSDGSVLESIANGTTTVIDTSSPYTGAYQPGVGAQPLDRADLQATATIANGTAICSDPVPTTVEIQDLDAWWQVVGGDVMTVNTTDGGSLGSLQSDVPSFLDPLLKFIKDGPSSYPGIPFFGGSSTGVSEDNVSSKSWISQGDGGLVGGGKSGYSVAGEKYNYDYFTALRPDGIVPSVITTGGITGSAFRTKIINAVADSNGYRWIDATHNSGLTITSAANIGENKAIVFIQKPAGTLNLNGNITLDDGNGFILFVVKGAIRVGENATSLEGLYVSDGDFDSCGDSVSGTCSNQLTVRGSVVTWGNLLLERDLALAGLNSTTPAEVFNFAPDLLFNFPSAFSLPDINWVEIAP